MKRNRIASRVAGRRLIAVLNRRSAELSRSLQGFKGDSEQFGRLQKAAENIDAAVQSLLAGSNEFLGIRMTGLSPDGLLGGSGYARKVSEIRQDLLDVTQKLSSIQETLIDESDNPIWSSVERLSDRRAREESEETSKRREAEETRKAVLDDRNSVWGQYKKARERRLAEDDRRFKSIQKELQSARDGLKEIDRLSAELENVKTELNSSQSEITRRDKALRSERDSRVRAEKALSSLKAKAEHDRRVDRARKNKKPKPVASDTEVSHVVYDFKFGG